MIGVFHDAGKELPIMYVVPNDGEKPTPKALRDFLTCHVAHYKIPRRFFFIEDLPRTATGKVLKKEIRKMYGETEQKHPA